MLLLGHSIFNRTCRTNVGEIAARDGGGGHRGAASVPLPPDADSQIQIIVNELRRTATRDRCDRGSASGVAPRYALLARPGT
jgi:nanoRNase/pAp phosphatase (c-di-AMP/oligoRNAs hydrolase)